MKEVAQTDSLFGRGRGCLAVLFLCLFLLPSLPAAARPAPTPLIEADTMSYDETSGIITAEGNVEISTHDRVLRADNVTYNKTTEVITATGNVAMMESSGEILFMEKLELTSDMREGFLHHIGILFPDDSRMVAQSAERFQGRYIIAERGVYTACRLCDGEPLWQVKGRRITHDSEKKDVIYRDTTIEFGGVPIFYTPYFSHPDPTVKRRQGFLSPSGGMNDMLGAFVRVPYYFDLAPNSDLLFAPVFSASDKVQLAADWRHRFESGSMNWTASITQTKFITQNGRAIDDRFRGHLFGTTNFNLTDTWRAGSQINYVSDKSYLLRYGIPYEDILVNRGYVEYFKGRHYGSANVYYFIDQRPNNLLVEPLVAPELRFSALGEPAQTWGGRWSFDAGLLVTTRDRDVARARQGASTRRLSINSGWERQLVSETGFLTTVAGTVRSDAYWSDNVPNPHDALGQDFKNVEYIRPFAQADITLRYPLGRHGQGYQQLLEPIALLSIAPNLSNTRILPNEDSLDVEFDETNIFSTNRHTGIDRIEGGTRISYGLRHAIIGDNGSRLEMLAGQVYRMRPEPSFPSGSGLDERFSDFVGNVSFAPSALFNMRYGFRLDKNNLDFTRHEASVSFGNKYFRPSINYIFIKRPPTETLGKSFLEELSYNVTSQLTDYWTLNISHLQAFKPSSGARGTSAKLTYQDECFGTGLTVRRDYTQRADVKDGTSVLFHFHLKNIGGFSTD